MLPFAPEPLDALRARVQAALVDVYDPASLTARPGERRAHVFDCDDGLRLIISRDVYPERRVPAIHMSASAQPPLLDAVRDGAIGKLAFVELAVERWRAIAGDHAIELTLVAFSEKGVPHWIETEQL